MVVAVGIEDIVDIVELVEVDRTALATVTGDLVNTGLDTFVKLYDGCVVDT